MKKLLVFLGIILLMVVFVFPMQIQAQEKAKKDRWELEIDYGQFWVHKWTMPNDIVEKTYNPDIRLAFRLRIFKGFYVGVIGGVKKETQKEFWQETIWSNYFWLEDRFGDFLFKDVTNHDLSILKTAPYIGAEAKLNLFTLKFSKKLGLTPFGVVGIKKWGGKSNGFVRTIDYTLLENGIPYLIFHGEYRFGQGTQTFWHVNPDGTKGDVYYSDKFSVKMSTLKSGPILFFGGGIQFRIGNFFSLPFSFQVEKRRDGIYLEGKKIGRRTFSHFLVQTGFAYRF